MDLVKGTGYKINIQNSVAFLYTSNKLSKKKKEIKEKIPCTTITKRKKYLLINLTKEVK